MLCLYKRISSSPTHNPLLKILTFLQFHQFSSQTQQPHKFSRENLNFSREKSELSPKIRPTLNPQAVHSTLTKCSSDLLALSFFLWCARQPNYFHEKFAFDYMVSVVRRLTERCKSVEMVVRRLESVGCDVKAKSLLLLLRVYWRGGMYNMVLETFELMGCFGFSPNTFVYNVLIDVLFRIGRVDVAMKILREIPNPNFLSFNIALCNLCRLSDLVNIKVVFRMMLRRRFCPNVETCEMVLNCFCKMGRLKGALQVFGLMVTRGCSLSVNAWSILIHGYCKCDMVGVASQLLEKMIESGYAPTVVTFTTLFRGYMKCGMVGSAMDVLKTMEARGITPDLVLCNVLIDCLTRVERYNEALDVFLSLPKRNLAPDSYTFSSLISTLCLSREFYLLPVVADGIDLEADLVVCNAMLKYFCKAGYPSLAVEFFNVIVRRGFTPDKYSFTGLLIGLCGSRRSDEAINLYNGLLMGHPCVDAHFHAAIMGGLIKSGKFHSAIRLFRRAVIQNYPLDVVSYTIALCGLLRSGRIGEACTLYNEMKEAGIVPNAHTFNIMVCGLCEGKDTTMLNQILTEMIDARTGLSSHSFRRLHKLLHGLHHAHSVHDLVSKMIELGLVPTTPHSELEFTGHLQGSNVSDEHLKVYFQDTTFTKMSGSDDFSDVAFSLD